MKAAAGDSFTPSDMNAILRNGKALLDVAVDGVCIHDFDGRIVEFSQSLADMLGYSRAEFAARNVADIDTRKSATAPSTAAPRDGVISETRYRRKDGTFIDVEVIAARRSCLSNQLSLFRY